MAIDPTTGQNLPDAPAAPDWFQNNAPPGSAPPGGGYGGVYQQIYDLFKKYTGKAPSDAQVKQWGGNIDANYLQKIENAIKTLGANSGYWDLSTDAPKAGPAAPSAGSRKSIQQIFNETTGGLDPTSQNLDKLIDALKANGYDASRATHAGNQPSDDKLVINGKTYDFIRDVGGSNPGWQFPGEDGDSSGGPGLLDPFTTPFAAPPDAKLPEFKAPNVSDIDSDPFYQATLQAGQRALERSAAAKGTLLTSGTLEDLQNNVVLPARATAYDKMWQNDLSNYGAQYGRANDVYNRALGEYGITRDNFYHNQDSPFAKLFAQSQQDSSNALGWASLFNNASGNGSNAYLNALFSGANATAAGQAGSGNIWGNYFGGLGNTALTAYLYSLYGNRRPGY